MIYEHFPVTLPCLVPFQAKHGSGNIGTIYLPPANEVCEGYVFTPVCQSFSSQGGEYLGRYPPGRSPHPPGRYPPPPWQEHPLGRYTPLGQVQPPGQVHLPPWAGTPYWAGTPPRQVHPKQVPPRQVHPPGRYTHPG